MIPFPIESSTLKINSNITPFPTNAFWKNIVLDNGDWSVCTYPFYSQIKDDSIRFGYNNFNSALNAYTTSNNADINFITLDDNYNNQVITKRQVNNYSPFGVNVSINDDNCQIEYVLGSPYITFLCNNIKPFVFFRSAVLKKEQTTSNFFKVTLNNKQIWGIYYENNPNLNYYSLNGVSGYKSQNNYTGYIRIFLLQTSEFTYSIDIEKLLLKYVDSIPYVKNHKLLFDFSKENIGKYKFYWSDEPVLMLLFPHHVQSLNSLYEYGLINNNNNNKYKSIKGYLQWFIGNQVEFVEQLPLVSFTGRYKIQNSEHIEFIKQILIRDKNIIPTSGDDTYYYSKAMACSCDQLHMAYEFGLIDVVNEMLIKIKTDIDRRLKTTAKDPFVYDKTIGGLMTRKCLTDTGANFGLGGYNDHHFHWGYFVYCLITLLKFDKSWMDTKGYTQLVDHFIMDYASTISTSYYPQTRHKEWFSGHSWASGLFKFGDVNNQESSSEAINAYRTVALYGQIINDKYIENFGKLLYATEIRATKTYWHIATSPNIYTGDFNKNKIAGIVWNKKVDYSTWFGANTEYIHGIQFIPCGLYLEDLLSEEFVNEARKQYAFGFIRHIVNQELDKLGVDRISLKMTLNQIDKIWNTVLRQADAIIDPYWVWNYLKNTESFDSRNTKSKVLYYVASQCARIDIQGQKYKILNDISTQTLSSTNINTVDLSIQTYLKVDNSVIIQLQNIIKNLFM
jgi:endo-1,3(4)-beta-glucanase